MQVARAGNPIVLVFIVAPGVLCHPLFTVLVPRYHQMLWGRDRYFRLFRCSPHYFLRCSSYSLRCSPYFLRYTPCSLLLFRVTSQPEWLKGSDSNSLLRDMGIDATELQCNQGYYTIILESLNATSRVLLPRIFCSPEVHSP